MTFEVYNKKMDALVDRLKSGENTIDKINEFQSEYMKNVLKEYKENADTPAKKECSEILDYLVSWSETGSVVHYIEDKTLADQVMEIIWEELGDYMLDGPQYYEEDGQYVIDCMFAGYYTPGWDGWEEYLDRWRWKGR